jgi:hypothetical protein
MCGQRAAVVERNSRAHQEKVGEAVLRYLHGTRSEAVHGIGRVVGAHHQTCEGELHALGGIALEYESVQGIECEGILVEDHRRRHMRKQATLRRICTDIIELPEVRRIFEIAKC